MERPTFISRSEILTDRDYIQWIEDLKTRFRQSQLKTAIRVNSGMLEFYWSVGRDIVAMRVEERWGEGVVKQVSLDLRNAFPNEKGFSYTNVKYMRKWYSFYDEQLKKGHQLGDQLQAFGHQAGDQLQMPADFALVPWRHHVNIVYKSMSLEEALFYVHQTIDGNWSRSRLEAEMDKGLYQSKGSALTNFNTSLTKTQGDLAKEVLKDPYHFDFLNMQEGYDEKDLENALVANITRFLLELGKGFAFVGRQMELQMDDGTSFFPDLVFYHIPMKSYVIIELKAAPYKPEFAGKINFYISAADELLKGEGDNPSIGLIICKSSNKTTVEWSMRGIDRPLGVATYQLEDIVERTISELELKKKNASIDSEENGH